MRLFLLSIFHFIISYPPSTHGIHNYTHIIFSPPRMPKRKKPYLVIIGFPEANDRRILHVSARPTTFAFFEQI